MAHLVQRHAVVLERLCIQLLLKVDVAHVYTESAALLKCLVLHNLLVRTQRLAVLPTFLQYKGN